MGQRGSSSVGTDEFPKARYVGEILGEAYRITRKIGSGGMADVYEVEHLRLGSRFAAKVARTGGSDGVSLRRFVKEAKLLSSLSSDHIVKVFDLSKPEDRVPYYIMELLDGRDLRQLIRHASELSVARATSIVLDACRGVSVMHAAGLVHRDLKPENLFVTTRDSGLEVCKLLDFGVVKGKEGNSTQHGALIGTVKYMSPEQIEQSGVVSARSDVYSLGAILYECLTGRPPHVADTLERLLYKILNDAPVSLGSLRPELPAELTAVVMRALDRDGSRRYPSANAFASALEPFTKRAEDLVETIPPDGLERPHASKIAPRTRASGLRPAFLSLAGLVALSVLVLAFTDRPSGASLQREPKRASPTSEPVPANPGALALPAQCPPPPASSPSTLVSASPATTAVRAANDQRDARGRGLSAIAPPARAARVVGPRIEETNPYGP